MNDAKSQFYESVSASVYIHSNERATLDTLITWEIMRSVNREPLTLGESIWRSDGMREIGWRISLRGYYKYPTIRKDDYLRLLQELVGFATSLGASVMANIGNREYWLVASPAGYARAGWKENVLSFATDKPPIPNHTSQ